MTTHWLIPVTRYDGFTLFGHQRIACDSIRLQLFRERVSQCHPHALLSFKAPLLLSDESEEVCGSLDLNVDWNNGQDIRFDSKPYSLSHCAEAFLDRSPDPEGLLACLHMMQIDDWPVDLVDWLKLIQGWLENGSDVIILKEG
jgi:hypothetical protein